MSAYSKLDQRVHKVAFSSRMLQMSMADMEDSMFSKDLKGITGARPIFITSLPRAGTTILLTALAHVPGLATHLYRDMPFLMAPMLWNRLSKGFRKDSTLAERAHGDGIQVGYDSPEAFEEVIWKAFWPDHYKGDGITLWTGADRNAEAEEFLRKHLCKIIALRCGPNAAEGRYISKNNGNVARIPLLRAIFPDADIVVPVRDPVTHAASLWRQHKNFLTQHAEDPFVKRYMGDIGHYEFGQLHRPIQFPTLAARTDGTTPEDLDYWLGYWIAAFEHLQGLDDGILFVSHEAQRNDGLGEMTRLCDQLGLEPGAHLAEVAGEFTPLPDRPIAHELPADRVDHARALYQSLTGTSL
ncbi:sulfotransferase [Fluviibacterium sp. DFM31]|uniref:Sulfotransferase n=1 Tax=Meridianimarinicoccus marinus TaxID=3231483 RepID=A0ABV3LCI4_9RHOB